MRNTLVSLALLALALTACTSDAPLDGTYSGAATTPLPSPPLPTGDLAIDATLRLDSATSTFELDTDLAALGLVDVMNVRGTFVAANGMLTLEPTEFEVDPASGNTVANREDGTPCITLAGFVSTEVCMPEATSAYTRDGDTFTFTLTHEIAGVAGTTPFTLTAE